MAKRSGYSQIYFTQRREQRLETAPATAPVVRRGSGAAGPDSFTDLNTRQYVSGVLTNTVDTARRDALVRRWDADSTFDANLRNTHPDVYAAIDKYKANFYHAEINGYLRDPQYAYRALDKNGLETMKTALDRLFTLPGSTAPENVHVYRGINNDKFYDAVSGPDAVGRVITDKGYFSTSLGNSRAIDIANNYDPYDSAADRPLVLQIEVPKGSRAAYIEGVKNAREDEVLLPRNSQFQITGRSKMDYAREDYDINLNPIQGGGTVEVLHLRYLGAGS